MRRESHSTLQCIHLSTTGANDATDDYRLILNVTGSVAARLVGPIPVLSPSPNWFCSWMTHVPGNIRFVCCRLTSSSTKRETLIEKTYVRWPRSRPEIRVDSTDPITFSRRMNVECVENHTTRLVRGCDYLSMFLSSFFVHQVMWFSCLVTLHAVVVGRWWPTTHVTFIGIKLSYRWQTEIVN